MTTDIKEILRQSLLEEQGHLCAYCMSKLNDEIKIEHYEPRNAQNELDYSNLLAVCNGDTAGNLSKRQHCDTRKRDHILHINPQNSVHIHCISYESNGTIYAKDHADFDYDLNTVLNLNDDYGYLKANRKRALDELKKKLKKKFGNRPANLPFIKNLLSYYLGKNQFGERTADCGILIDYLSKRLKRWG